MKILDLLARGIGSLFRESLSKMILAETMEDDQTIVMKNGTMMSMIALDGALHNPGENEMADMIERLRLALSPYLSNPGHMIDFTFMRDAGSAREQLGRIIDKIERASGSLGLDILDVLDERRRVLSESMIAETILIVIHTRSDVLSKDEHREEKTRTSNIAKEIPVMVRAGNPARAMDLVHVRHSAMVEAMAESFEQIGQMAHILKVSDILQETRAALYPDTAPFKTDWQPRLPDWATDNRGMKAFINMPETPTEFAGLDYSPLFEPSFDRQLATHDAFVENSKTVRFGNRLFSSFDMTVPPESLPAFNELVMDITSKSINLPWRCSIRIESGGIHSQSLKLMFLNIFGFSARIHNDRIKNAILNLKEVDGQIDTVVKFRMSFATWSEINEPDLLRRNTQILVGAAQRWGNSRADGISGEPLATLLSVMPGATLSSTAPVAGAPLEHVLAMSPLGRQASPWDYGSVLYRTDDGKPWPYQPGSSKQSTWVTLLIGTPGSGKSVMMNAINFASAISPSSAGGGTPVLPRIAIIDIGESSSGVISLAQEALPANRRHEVVFRKLRMNVENAINVFDTQLGMRKPTSNERDFLINFLSLICGTGIEAPSQIMTGLITGAIDQVYAGLCPDKQPHRYTHELEPDIDKLLHEIGFETNDKTVWWDVVDVLMLRGHLYEASIAQRYAVPTLTDLIPAVLSNQVANLYREAEDSETTQGMLESFQRIISEVIREYPILSTHTRFSLGSARIVSLDLMDVVTSGDSMAAKKRTALMYMLARQVLTRDFFIHESDFHLAMRDGTLPKMYLEYHVKRARENLQLPKLFCMDEFHRTGRIPMITNQVFQDAREGRKFNIDIKISSQFIQDFPASIVAIATALFVCNTGSEDSITYLDEQFHLTENEKRIMRTQLTGPGKRGAPVWAMFKIAGKGTVRQKLNLKLGPVEIWALCTTSEDVTLRRNLYEILGPRLARKILARRFPGGSAKSEIEDRIARMSEIGGNLSLEQQDDVIGELVEELKSAAYMIEKEDLALDLRK